MSRTSSAKPQVTLEQHRPDLTADLAPAEFLAWYWLKEEMVQFCRANGLPTAGSKPELESRIEAFLAGQPLAKRTSPARPATKMPSTFRPEMRIEPGWRCNPALGAYFRSTLGNGFRFNKPMRDFIHTQCGKALLEAEHCYLASIRPGAVRPPILRQLEYNQHLRDFYAAHPGATRKDAIEAWWQKRRSRKASPET